MSPSTHTANNNSNPISVRSRHWIVRFRKCQKTPLNLKETLLIFLVTISILIEMVLKIRSINWFLIKCNGLSMIASNIKIMPVMLNLTKARVYQILASQDQICSIGSKLWEKWRNLIFRMKKVKKIIQIQLTWWRKSQFKQTHRKNRSFWKNNQQKSNRNK